MLLSIEAFVAECVANSTSYSVLGYIIKALITLWILTEKV